MALAYTAPTWTNGSGEGISASNLQAMSDCIEGLVQGSDKAIHSISFNNGIATVTYADGSVESNIPANMKGISSIAKTGTSGNIDTYTITYTDGSTSTFTVTNGADGSFYIVTAGIKSTDDPYGNIEYYIGGDFYKNGVLYNQSAFYKVTLVDETEYPPSPYLIDGSSGTFTNGHYSTGSIGGIPSGATITTQIFTDSTMTTLLGEVKVLIGLRGSEGEQGPAGDDGVSPEVTITTITGGHRVNITDEEHPSGQNFDVMDGQDGASDWSEITNKPNFATVATSGSYNDLSNKPTIPAAQVNSDWNAASGVAQILNKPTIPAAQIQSDWNQTSTSAKDYIKNKPDLSDYYSSSASVVTTTGDNDFYPLFSNGNGKRQIIWSDIKSALKSYFDALYSKVVANPSGTATGTLTKLGIGSDIYEIQSSGGADKADTTLIAPVQSTLTASKAYAVGEQFVYNQVLYKVTQAIASGATITVGTNCELAGNITEQLGKNVLLWTNTNPTQDFTAQNIDAVKNTMSYDFFIIILKITATGDYITEQIVSKNSNADTGPYGKFFEPSGATRDYGFRSSSGSFFVSGAYKNSTLSNNYLVPWKIYGVKY